MGIYIRERNGEKEVESVVASGLKEEV
jgi:hypothetical protein